MHFIFLHNIKEDILKNAGNQIVFYVDYPFNFAQFITGKIMSQYVNSV